jgi:hypothetical protein
VQQVRLGLQVIRVFLVSVDIQVCQVNILRQDLRVGLGSLDGVVKAVPVVLVRILVIQGYRVSLVGLLILVTLVGLVKAGYRDLVVNLDGPDFQANTLRLV